MLASWHVRRSGQRKTKASEQVVAISTSGFDARNRASDKGVTLWAGEGVSVVSLKCRWLPDVAPSLLKYCGEWQWSRLLIQHTSPAFASCSVPLYKYPTHGLLVQWNIDELALVTPPSTLGIDD